ncbi:siphovirus ReqiPepy6 Gp37-like family protein [Clostridium beijerinckii]|uniref:siphovirus ReqiPepy6 Gp37-like family protein n=1 Tax=Clostridium beijerinckii TaxID=1520 RepID=UPI000479B51A|nr:siphovirus ReqiPepy6 Gp37-like family protein [Clostridium beijerinckii]
MELLIFDRNLTFKGIVEGFISFRYVRKYFEAGEFELHCGLTPEVLSLLKRENIIYIKGDPEAAYIEYVNLKQDEEGKEIIIVKGYFLTGYLNRRIIWGTEIINDTTENAMRQLVNHNCINPADLSRIINNLTLGSLKGFNESVNYQVSYSNLAEEIKSLSNISNLGHRIKFDPVDKDLIFEVYKGQDRSISQNINPRIIFSKEFENVLSQEFTDSLNNYKNLVLIGGIGEGPERKLATVGNAAGLDRFEIFADQKSLTNVDKDNNVLSEQAYNDLLIEKGNEALAATKEVLTFDSTINVNSNLTYKKDFDLGDIVTCVSKRWNLVINTRITEIEEVYEPSGQSINITFGNNIPTLIDKLKQKMRG